MKRGSAATFLMFAVALAGASRGTAWAQAQTATLPLAEMKPGVEDHLRPNCNQVVFALSKDPKTPGINVRVNPGKEDFPGLGLVPTKAVWDLSKFGHITAKLVNTGKDPITVALRVDNDGDWKDNPWNTETVHLAPGESQPVTAIFGYSYGHKRGFALKPSAINHLLLFVVGSDKSQSFRIESLEAGGPAGEQPPIDPDDVRLVPKSGVMFGDGVLFDLGSQLAASNVQPLVVDGKLRLAFPASKEEQGVTYKLPSGAWDLRESLQVTVTLKNMGKEPILPRIRLRSKGGPSDWVSAKAPILPGKSEGVVVKFEGTSSAVIGKKETGSHITSDAITAVDVAADSAGVERVLYLESIRATAPEVDALPDWVGKKPPVPGDWTKTLDEEFSDSTLDTSLWSPFGENYYDKVSHWSRENVILKDGVLMLRYSKKPGFQNDDPKRQKSDYAAGYLQSWDHWAQRYGYFESRMKLPKAPGLWPAFWMMPDRGRADKPDHRQATEDGGMEFDIMEHLTRWGPYRYNISLHYDGYGVNHKAVGSDKIYVQPDKDGYLTCGLLWTPGSAVFYCNGKEVLRWDDPRISNVPEHFIFTLPSGGWDNNALDDLKLPSDFIVDYVRVWQRKDLALPTDGKKPPLPGAGKL